MHEARARAAGKEAGLRAGRDAWHLYAFFMNTEGVISRRRAPCSELIRLETDKHLCAFIYSCGGAPGRARAAHEASGRGSREELKLNIFIVLYL